MKKLEVRVAKKSKDRRGRSVRRVYLRAEKDNHPGYYQVDASGDDDDDKIEAKIREIERFHDEKIRRHAEFRRTTKARVLATTPDGPVTIVHQSINWRPGGQAEVLLMVGIEDTSYPGASPKRYGAHGPYVLRYESINHVPSNDELFDYVLAKVAEQDAETAVEETERAALETRIKGRLDRAGGGD